jgi:hypothetical protein
MGARVAAHVTVDEQIFERQGIKVVITEDGHMRQYSPGEIADPNGELVQHDGEPSFLFRLDHAVHSDDDVPGPLREALTRAAQRLFRVQADGSETDDECAYVEVVGGPDVQDGAIAVGVDTDGNGFNRAVIDTMVGIFVEELSPLEVPVEITAAPWPDQG